MSLNLLAHIIIIGVTHTFKAKCKMALLYTINHIIMATGKDSRVRLLIYPCCCPQSPKLSSTVGGTADQKGEATCPRPHVQWVGQGWILEPNSDLLVGASSCAKRKMGQCEWRRILHSAWWAGAAEPVDPVTRTPADRTVILLWVYSVTHICMVYKHLLDQTTKD